MPTPASTNGTKHAAGYWDGSRKDRPRLDPAYLPVLTGAMTDSISDRLAAQGINLPEPAAPVAAYVLAVEAGGLIHISGQLPFDEGKLMNGRPGEDRDIEIGRAH